jgi:hypothetical protein
VHAAAKRDQPWDEAWRDFQEARQELLALLGGMSDAELERHVENPWGAHASAYGWGHAYLGHEREHAAMLREVLLGGEKA